MGWVWVESFSRIPLPQHDMLNRIDTPNFIQWLCIYEQVLVYEKESLDILMGQRT